MTAVIRQYGHIPYIRIDSLPDDKREPFERWIHGQTQSIIPDEFDGLEDPASCAHAWDYARWIADERTNQLADPYHT